MTSPRRVARCALAGASLLALAAGVGGYVAIDAYRSACTAPCVSARALSDASFHAPSRVLDRRGEEIAVLSKRNREALDLASISPNLVRAVLAVEDHRFHEHGGVDLRRVVQAGLRNLRERRPAEGASTLSMQLARNLFPDLLPPEKTFDRKLREVRVARELEAAWSKDRILETYLNHMFLGAGAYGVEAAAQTYFGESAREVSIEQAALIAGLLQAPSAYNPRRFPERARQRRDVVLRRMYTKGALSGPDLARALREPLGLRDAPEERPPDAAPYFVEALRPDLERRFGDALYRDGLQVHTTLDPHLQGRARGALSAQLDSIDAGGSLQGSVVVLDLEGRVLAMVGGRDFQVSPFNRALDARRQAGSTIKPVVFAAAVEDGYGPADTVDDGPVEIPVDEGVWSPRGMDAADGDVPLARALAESRNRATVHLSQMVGLDAVVRMGRAVGLNDLPALPSMVLGSSSVRPIDLAAAYIPFARDDGRGATPYMVERVLDRHGNEVYGREPGMRDALSERTSYLVRHMLRAAVDEGTGRAARSAGMDGPVGGKTGTTNAFSDAWFVGVTPAVSAAVWIGHDTPEPISATGGSPTGGRVAAPVWAHALSAHEHSGQTWERPPSVDTNDVSLPLRTRARSEPDEPDDEPEPEESDDEPASEQLCLRQPTSEERQRVGGEPISYMVPCSDLPR